MSPKIAHGDLGISGNQKAQMMGGVDQHEIIPLLFRERAEKGVRERGGLHFLKGGDFGTELVEGGGLVVTGAGEPPLGNLDARLHPSLADDAFEDQRARDFADDPGGPMLCAAKSRSQTFADMIENLRQIPVPGADIMRAVQAVDIRQCFRPAFEIQPSSLHCGRRHGVTLFV